MSDHEIEAAKRLLERNNYRVLGPHEGEWRPDEELGTVTYYETGQPPRTEVDQARLVEANLDGAFALCGCGNPENVQDALAQVLAVLDTRALTYNTPEHTVHWEGRWTRIRAAIMDAFHLVNVSEELVYFVLYYLDGEDLTEHGSNVGGSWLTSKGMWALDQVKARAEAEGSPLFRSTVDHRA